jgi:hypothetical protein
MEGIADLAFLPFSSHRRADGTIEVVVSDQVTLLVEPGVDDPSQGGPGVSTIMVIAVRARSSVARAS